MLHGKCGINNMKESYKNKKVLITGYTGFKGSWMSFHLHQLGANVIGIALESNIVPSLFNILDLELKINSRIIDIRNLKK